MYELCQLKVFRDALRMFIFFEKKNLEWQMPFCIKKKKKNRIETLILS